MQAKAIKGMSVMSLQEGTRLGRVEHALFDVAARRFGALAVHGDDGDFIVPFEQIESIGTDAITVRSSQVTQTPTTGGAFDALASPSALGKLKVVDQAGTLLGTINDIEFDASTGQVTELSAHAGGMLGLGGTTTTLAASSILTVGPDIITVSSDSGTTT